jgi:hypothetical protein
MQQSPYCSFSLLFCIFSFLFFSFSVLFFFSSTRTQVLVLARHFYHSNYTPTQEWGFQPYDFWESETIFYHFKEKATSHNSFSSQQISYDKHLLWFLSSFDCFTMPSNTFAFNKCCLRFTIVLFERICFTNSAIT